MTLISDSGTKPEPLIVTDVPAGPSEGESSIDGAATATPVLIMAESSVANKTQYAMLEGRSILLRVPVNCVIFAHLLAFKVNITGIKELGLHS